LINVETVQEGARIQVDTNVCQGCGVCLSSCPEKALYVVAGHAEVDEQRCTGCGDCISACPNGALSVVESAALRTESQPAAVEIVAAGKQMAPMALQPRRAAWLGILASAVQVALPRLLDFWLSRAESPTQEVAAPSQESTGAVAPLQQASAGGRRYRHRSGQMRHGSGQKRPD